jgi:pyruvate,orthophosphate dikinase
MLQTRSGKRTGYAAVVIATDLVAERLLTPNEGLLLVDPSSLSQLLSPVFDPKEWKTIPVATKGLPASPGAASGQVVFTATRPWRGPSKARRSFSSARKRRLTTSTACSCRRES